MKAEVLSTKGEKKGKMELPVQFSEEFHPDIIKRAFSANQSLNYNHHGTDPRAGVKHVVRVKRRRNVYRTGYGKGASRTPGKVVSRNGNRLSFVGEQVPFARKGRTAFPPLVEKIFEEKINIKERLFAIRSAISATIKKVLVEKRNHKIGKVELPIIVEGAEKLSKTAEVKKMIESFGLKDELTRAKERKVRAGIGKMRGRKYKSKKGPLLVVSKTCPLLKSSKSMQGVEAITVNNLNVTLLAPGGVAGRLTIWTKESIDELNNKKLFLGEKK
ncbi:MAG: 50S ribosomal protein L4 [Candidatus Nanoarchaeia archaeon]|nr:50S ribosomal protein L4 [Candidatus Nanoarchaeia archaeon]